MSASMAEAAVRSSVSETSRTTSARPMAVARMKAWRPARFFLSEAVRGDEFLRGGAEGRQGAEGEDEVGHAGEVLLADGPASESEMKRGDGSPGYSLAVQQALVAGGGFDGVAEGVAEVENHAQV